jgi:hypothetical protein
MDTSNGVLPESEGSVTIMDTSCALSWGGSLAVRDRGEEVKRDLKSRTLGRRSGE